MESPSGTIPEISTEDEINSNEDSLLKCESPSFKTLIEYESDICKLKAQILNSENTINELKRQNQSLLSENSKLKSSNQRLSFISKGRSLSINPHLNSSQNNLSYQLAEAIKEKNDLQELNEHMLNMLTEKEVENGELKELFETYKHDKQFQIDELNERISELLEENETFKEKEMYLDSESNKDAIDELQAQYYNYKLLMESEIKNYEHRIERLTNQNDDLSHTINKLNTEIQALELDNLNWLTVSEMKDKQNQIDNEENYFIEIEKLKTMLRQSEDNKTHTETKLNEIISIKNEEINELQHKKEELIKQIESTREELTRDNAKMLLEYAKMSRDLNIAKRDKENLNTKLTETTSELNQHKELLDKKTNELKEINTAANKIMAQKENIINQLEDKINQITSDKNDLIEQNKSLLNQIKENSVQKESGCSLGDVIEQANINELLEEKKLFEEEIKMLQERMQTQSSELVNLHSTQAQLKEMNEENQKLKKELNEMKLKYEEQVKAGDYKNIQLRTSLNFQKKKTFNLKRQMSINPKLINNEQKFEKQIALLKQMKENELKFYNEQIDKLNQELAHQKVIVATQAFEHETLIIKYRNVINKIIQECKKRGITLSVKSIE